LIASLRAQGIRVAKRFAANGGDFTLMVADPDTEVVEVVFQRGSDFARAIAGMSNDVYAATKYTHPQYPCFNAVQADEISYI